MFLPIRVGQDHHQGLLGLILRSEGAPQGGWNAEDGEKVRRDRPGGDLLGGMAGRRQTFEVVNTPDREVGEDRILLAKVAEIAG